MEIKEKLRKIRKKISRKALYYLTLAGVFIASSIPIEIARAMGRFLGKAAFYIFASERRKTISHLNACFGDKKSASEKRQIAIKCFSSLGESFFDILILPKLILKGEDCIDIENVEALEECKKSGKGTLVISGHIGAWELIPCKLNACGFKMSVIARDINNQGINRLLVNYREKHGTKTFLRNDPGSARRILRELKKGNNVAALIDQDTKVDSCFVEFFGKEASTPIGPAKFAIAGKTNIIVVYIVKEKDGKNIIKVKGPLKIEKTGDKKIDALKITKKATQIIEGCIREYPDQWVWMHRRWKTQRGDRIE